MLKGAFWCLSLLLSSLSYSFRSLLKSPCYAAVLSLSRSGFIFPIRMPEVFSCLYWLYKKLRWWALNVWATDGSIEIRGSRGTDSSSLTTKSMCSTGPEKGKTLKNCESVLKTVKGVSRFGGVIFFWRCVWLGCCGSYTGMCCAAPAPGAVSVTALWKPSDAI